MKRLLRWALGLAAVLGLLIGAVWYVLQPDVTYYRVNVSLSHGDEPIVLDVVVSCTWGTTGGFGTARKGVATRRPYVFAQRTQDNHVVVLQPPNACANVDRAKDGVMPGVPADLLPLVLWGESADRLGELTAYVSENGYTHPLSQLTFGKATVSPATKADQRRWRATSAPNLITKANDPFTDWHPANFSPGTIMGGMSCRGARLLPVPEAQRAALRELWPETRPTYWLPDDRKDDEQIWLPTIDAWPGSPPSVEWAHGLPRASGLGKIDIEKVSRYAPNDYVPVIYEQDTPWVPGVKSPPRRADVLAYDFRRSGLMDCRPYPSARDQYAVFIDGQRLVSGRPSSNFILGYVRDEMMIRPSAIHLSTELGDLD